MKLTPLPLAALLSLSLAAAVLAGNPLPNPGFEDGDKQWKFNDQMAKVVADAAHEGAMGLRITDDDAVNGSSVQSSSLPVKAGQDVELDFWARTKTDFSGVYLFFMNAAGKTIADPAVKGGHPVAAIKKTDGNWNAYQLTAKAPADAVSVAVWIHSFSTAKGTVDLDDFSFTGLEEGAAPVKVAVSAPAPAAPDLSKMPPRKKPAVIIIKVDDLREVGGQIPGAWKKVADFVKQRGIKASMGIICETLGQSSEAYCQWIKDQQASGRIEFWFHGYDHKVHEENGVKCNEFNTRTYEDQLDRFARSQKMAIEKLGFPFRTFGPGGGVGSASQDANTIRAMADDPYMKIWLYPTPIDAGGKQLDAAGKVTILDRVFAVNLEAAVGVPDFNRLVSGYAKYPDREYFVLQGHPMQWGTPEKWDQFVKIVDFLIGQHAVFMTPSEYVASRAGKKE